MFIKLFHFTISDTLKLVMTMSSFGSRLRVLRRSSNLKQEELAAVLNISKSAVSMYERDEREPSFQLIKQLAAYFNVTTDNLLGYQTNKSNPHGKEINLEQLSEDEVEYLKETLEVYRKMKRKTWLANDKDE